MSASEASRAEGQQLLRDMAAEAAELKQAAGGSVTDAVAAWLAPQYLLAARQRLDGAPAGERLEILKAFVQDWAMLRRGEHSAARLQLEREHLDWRRSHSQAQKEKEFWEWLERPEIRAKIFPNSSRGLSPETLANIERELKLL